MSDSDAVKRLKSARGHVGAIIRMIEDDRYCVDVLTQIAAIRSALDAVAMQLLENHAHGCVQSAIRAGHGHEAVNEFMSVVQRLTR